VKPKNRGDVKGVYNEANQKKNLQEI